MVTSIVVKALGIVTNGLERRLEELEIKGRIETTALLRSDRILRSPEELRRFAITQTPRKDYKWCEKNSLEVKLKMLLLKIIFKIQLKSFFLHVSAPFSKISKFYQVIHDAFDEEILSNCY